METVAGVGVSLPPRIREQVESLASELGMDAFGHAAVEFELQRGRLQSTFIKLGRIKNQELEELAVALAGLR